MTVPPPPPPGSDPRDDGSADDIDAEFARMMEGFDAPDLDASAFDEPAPEQPGADGAARGEGGANGAAADGASLADREITIEDILSAPAFDADAAAASDADAPRPIALIATSVASAKALAGALRLAGDARRADRGTPTDAPSTASGADAAGAPGEATLRVHGTDAGAVVIAALDEADAHAAAARVSTALAKLGVVLFWRRGDRMTATRYRAGERGDDVSPALVLGGVDPRVEQIMIGAADADELGEGIDPSSVSRMQALRWLATGRGRG